MRGRTADNIEQVDNAVCLFLHTFDERKNVKKFTKIKISKIAISRSGEERKENLQDMGSRISNMVDIES